jgi:hypothetical protein
VLDAPEHRHADGGSVRLYEHLPVRPEIRRDLPRRFSLSEFGELRDSFAYFLSAAEIAALEQDFRNSRKLSPRPSSWRRR